MRGSGFCFCVAGLIVFCTDAMFGSVLFSMMESYLFSVLQREGRMFASLGHQTSAFTQGLAFPPDSVLPPSDQVDLGNAVAVIRPDVSNRSKGMLIRPAAAPAKMWRVYDATTSTTTTNGDAEVNLLWKGRFVAQTTEIIHRAAVNNIVIVVLSSDRFHTTVVNWLCAARMQGLQNVLIMATEIGTYRKFKAINVPVIFLDVAIKNRRWKPDYSYHDALWVARWEVIKIALNAGVSVTHVDGDAVFVNDPSKIYALKGDIVFSRDVPDLRWILCMGWVFLRSTSATRQLVNKFTQLMINGVPSSAQEQRHDDQLAMNYLVFNESSFQWNNNVNPLSSQSSREILRGVISGHSTSGASLSVDIVLLPNTMVWRNNCRSDVNVSGVIAVHCRDIGGVMVTQDKTPGAKRAALGSMGAWFWEGKTGCKRQNGGSIAMGIPGFFPKDDSAT